MTSREKKKFGKNLNRLVKPAPPIANDNAKPTSKNGLLLLSTKKASKSLLSGNNKTVTAAGSPTKRPALHQQSAASTHDACVSAVVGMREAEAAMPPDAWGVRCEQRDGPQQQVQVPTEETTISVTQPTTTRPATPPAIAPSYQADDTTMADETLQGKSLPQWDEYGGRNQHSYNTRQRATPEEETHREEEYTSNDPPRANNTPPKKRTLWEPQQETHPQTTTLNTQNKIQLSSYEDIDRGERNSGPRMLFDPKSGAMVTVKTLKEPKKNERIVKKKEKNLETTEPKKNGKNKPKAKKKESGKDTAQNEPKKSTTTDRPKNRHGPNNNRTEGQAGRGRNPPAYGKFNKQPHSTYQEEMYGEYDYNNNKKHNIEEYQQEELQLQTGFNPVPLDYVKATDKIELVTGMDESPSLKPTAKEWAPSQAAIAAANAAVAEKRSTGSKADKKTSVQVDSSEDDIDADGLGFDPTEHMEFVMQSPSHEMDLEDRMASMDLNALSLEPQMYPSGSSAIPRNLFAFGTSETWSTANSNNINANWGASTGGGASGLFGSNTFPSNPNGKAREADTPSFLSMPSGASWGSPSLPGFGNSNTNITD